MSVKRSEEKRVIIWSFIDDLGGFFHFVLSEKSADGATPLRGSRS
jgi:hypothetical protein